MKKDILVMIGEILFLLFQFTLYSLKQSEIITWSWWLVMLPTLILAGITLSLAIAFVVLVVLKKRNRAKIERLKKEAREKKYY